MTESGEHLETVRILNDRDSLATTRPVFEHLEQHSRWSQQSR